MVRFHASTLKQELAKQFRINMFLFGLLVGIAAGIAGTLFYQKRVKASVTIK